MFIYSIQTKQTYYLKKIRSHNLISIFFCFFFYFHQLYEKEKADKAQLQKETQEIKIELAKLKEDKKVKNEYILASNRNLVRKLHKEKHLKLNLIEELLEPRSHLNQMNSTQRKQLLMQIRSDCIVDIEKSQILAEDKSSPLKVAKSKTFSSPAKSAFV